MLVKDELVTIESLSSDGTYERLGEHRMTVPFPPGDGCCMPDAGDWFAMVSNNRVSVTDIGPGGLSEPRLLGRHEGELVPHCIADPLGRYLVTHTLAGEIRLWDVSGQRAPTTTQGPPLSYDLGASRDGSFLYAGEPTPGEKTWDVWVWRVEGLELELLRRLRNVPSFSAAFDPEGLHFAVRAPNGVMMWPLGAPSGAEPISLRFGRPYWVGGPAFSPDGQWVATSSSVGLHLWQLARQYPAVLRFDFGFRIGEMGFAPDGSFLATTGDNTVTVSPLEGLVPASSHTVFQLQGSIWTWGVVISPDGSQFAVGSHGGGLGPLAWIGRDDGEEPRILPVSEGGGAYYATFSPDGRWVAMLTGVYDPTKAVFRVWDVQSASEVAVLRLDDAVFRGGAAFTDDVRLLTATSKGIVAWDVLSGEHQLVVESDVGLRTFVASDNGRKLLFTEGGERDLREDPAGNPIFVDLDAGTRTVLTTHGVQVLAMALDSAGRLAVTGDRTGVVRVGPVTGEEPHLLLGHGGVVSDVAVDPLGRWIASNGHDNTVRLWPMPDLSKPPLHSLPRRKLIAKLETLTNIRVVRDPESATGWKLTHDPFPGWETVPTW
jgi:WD40 repeat protein